MSEPTFEGLFVIHWRDSRATSGWSWLRQESPFESFDTWTAGWIVGQPNPDLVVVATTRGARERDGDFHVHGLLRIPRPAIVAMERVLPPGDFDPEPRAAEKEGAPR